MPKYTNEEDWKKFVNDHYNDSSSYLGKQYDNENESTKALINYMLESIPGDSDCSILDAGCGDGGVLKSVMARYPNASFAGFDLADDMVTYAKNNLPSSVHIDTGNLMKIDDFSSEKYDMVYTVHTMSLFNSFEELLLSLMGSAKKHVFVNSLFSKHNVDVIAHSREEGHSETTWSVFSMKRVREFALANGAKNVEFREFLMPFALPETESGMGSYTKEVTDGSFMSFSGPIYLPWYFLRVDL